MRGRRWQMKIRDDFWVPKIRPRACYLSNPKENQNNWVITYNELAAPTPTNKIFQFTYANKANKTV